MGFRRFDCSPDFQVLFSSRFDFSRIVDKEVSFHKKSVLYPYSYLLFYSNWKENSLLTETGDEISVTVFVRPLIVLI